MVVETLFAPSIPLLEESSPSMDQQIPYRPRTSSETPPPFFARRSHGQLSAIKQLVKYVKQDISGKKDSREATVYVIQAEESHLVKIGYTSEENLERLQAISKACGVTIFRFYQTRRFQGAYRAEQILHKLLQNWGYGRYNCSCQRVNREWFNLPYFQAAGAVKIIEGWFIEQQPYIPVTIPGVGPVLRLSLAWSRTLDAFHNSQTTEQPVEWMEFFLTNGDYPEGRELSSPRNNPTTPARGPGVSSSATNTGSTPGRPGHSRILSGSAGSSTYSSRTSHHPDRPRYPHSNSEPTVTPSRTRQTTSTHLDPGDDDADADGDEDEDDDAQIQAAYAERDKEPPTLTLPKTRRPKHKTGSRRWRSTTQPTPPIPFFDDGEISYPTIRPADRERDPDVFYSPPTSPTTRSPAEEKEEEEGTEVVVARRRRRHRRARSVV